MLPPDASAPAAPWRPLDERQRRVLGVLIEKAKTTPAGYPMTANAIVTACNQKNNREPLTAYDETDVDQALADLQSFKAVSEIDWLGRVPKYRHHAYEWLGVTAVEAAVLAELLLRGAQTLGDLRARAARMEPIADLAALRPVVDALLAKGLLLELTPAGRGQVVCHALYLEPELAVLKARHGGADARAAVEALGLAAEPTVASRPPAAGPLAALGAEVESLREEVARLTARVAALEARAGTVERPD